MALYCTRVRMSIFAISRDQADYIRGNASGGALTLTGRHLFSLQVFTILTDVIMVSDEETVNGDCNSPNQKPPFVFLNAALELQLLTALVSPAACFRAPSASQDCCT